MPESQYTCPIPAWMCSRHQTCPFSCLRSHGEAGESEARGGNVDSRRQVGSPWGQGYRGPVYPDARAGEAWKLNMSPVVPPDRRGRACGLSSACSDCVVPEALTFVGNNTWGGRVVEPPTERTSTTKREKKCWLAPRNTAVWFLYDRGRGISCVPCCVQAVTNRWCGDHPTLVLLEQLDAVCFPVCMRLPHALACCLSGELADGEKDQGDHQEENVLRRARLGRQR